MEAERRAPSPPLALGPVTAITYARSSALLTPATGFIRAYKFTLNPYNGCGFGCDYCYARFFTYSEGERERWGEWVRVKQNAAALIARAQELPDPAHRLEPGDSIFMSSVTDPYQPLEARLGLSRSILEALLPVQPRLTVQTRSPIVARDIDLLRQFNRLRVNLSIPTDSEDVRLRYEPHAPAIAVRLKTAERLAAGGVAIGISVSPMLPMRDPAAFGARLAELGAVEYVGQGFHRIRGSYIAGTGPAALAKARADGWTRRALDEAFDAIGRGLGPGRTLLRGAEGFVPA